MHESFAIFNVLMWWRCDGKFGFWGEFLEHLNTPMVCHLKKTAKTAGRLAWLLVVEDEQQNDENEVIELFQKKNEVIKKGASRMRRVLSSATLAGDRQGRTAALIWDRRSIWVITRESYKNHSSGLSRSNSAHLKEGLGVDRCLPIRRRPHQINCSARCPGRLCSLAAQNISLPCRAVPCPA